MHLNGGIPLLVQGRSEDGRWLQVMIPDGMVGWLSAAYVDVSSPVGDSPVLASQPVLDAGGNGRVGAISSLRLRAGPGTEYGTLGYLPGGTSLQVVGQTDDRTWLQVGLADGRSGWVAARYVEMTGDQGALEIPIEETAPPAVPIDFNGVVTGITGTSHQLYARGRELGNHANVFAKVGDSLTVSQYVLYPIGWGGYTLGSYGYLHPVINHFAAGRVGGVNPFSRISLSAGIGWSSAHVVDATLANRALCQAGEAPLRCEYRIARPSVAIIMLGTNDMTFMDAGGYSVYLRNIVGTSVDMGVIPVL
jgi:uncharacterized protein YraI